MDAEGIATITAALKNKVAPFNNIERETLMAIDTDLPSTICHPLHFEILTRGAKPIRPLLPGADQIDWDEKYNETDIVTDEGTLTEADLIHRVKKLERKSKALKIQKR